MKLNPDCIRDILLVVEENSDCSHIIRFSPQQQIPFESLEKYTNDEIAYHIRQCHYAGYFTRMDPMLDGTCLVYDLSPKGHDFLANIRSDNVWNKVKTKAAQVGVFSVNAITQIATAVVTEIINSQLKG